MVVSNILYDFLWISHNNKENSDIYTVCVTARTCCSTNGGTGGVS